MGRSWEAEAEYRQALAILQKLADDHPAVTEFRFFLANSHYSLGYLLLDTGRATEAEVESRQTLAVFQKLADDDPLNPDCRNELANAHSSLADVLRAVGRAAEARAGYDRAIAIHERLVNTPSSRPWFRSSQAATLRRRGLVRQRWAIGPARRPTSGRRSGCSRACPRGRARSGSRPPAAAGRWRAWPEWRAQRSRRPRGNRRPTRRWDCSSRPSRRATVTGPRSGPRPGSTRCASRPDFQLLMMDLAFPTEPFAQ